MCRCAHYVSVFDLSVHVFNAKMSTLSLQGVHVRSCMRSLFSNIRGRGWMILSSLGRGLVAGVILDIAEGELGVMSVSSLY